MNRKNRLTIKGAAKTERSGAFNCTLAGAPRSIPSPMGILLRLLILSISTMGADRVFAGLEVPSNAYRAAAGVYRVKFKASISVMTGPNLEAKSRIESTALVRIPKGRGRTSLQMRQGSNMLSLSGRITRLNYGWRRSRQHGSLHLRGPVTITSSSFDVAGLGGYFNLSALVTDRGVFPWGTFYFQQDIPSGRRIYGEFSHSGLNNAYRVSDLAIAKRFRERARLEAERARLEAFPPRYPRGGQLPTRL